LLIHHVSHSLINQPFQNTLLDISYYFWEFVPAFLSACALTTTASQL
jgi:hypothetical protein